MKKRHKGLSIKARVTLWYTFFMILVFGITAVYLVSSSQRMSGRQMRERLVDTVTGRGFAGPFQIRGSWTRRNWISIRMEFLSFSTTHRGAFWLLR